MTVPNCGRGVMPLATNEPPSPESDDGEPEGVSADRDAGDEAPDAEGTPLSDAVRTARLALQAMLGTEVPSPSEEDAPPEDLPGN